MAKAALIGGKFETVFSSEILKCTKFNIGVEAILNFSFYCTVQYINYTVCLKYEWRK
jgi:hypothetical protein